VSQLKQKEVILYISTTRKKNKKRKIFGIVLKFEA
jgi:hypothetical protein